MKKTINIAIAGLGTVGSSTVNILQQQATLLAARTGTSIKIVAVSARDATKKRDCDISACRFETDAHKLAEAKDVDIVVELMGGSEGAARTLVEAALKNGKHVVTANKALIATHGTALARLAEENNVSLCFEAAVAGGIPILKLLREGLAANQTRRAMGILNGTCNYILTHMWEEKRSFDDVLAEAQKLGYAEADPTFDVDGIDTAHKLAILTAIAYGTTPDISRLHIEGIRNITLLDMEFAHELGYAIKLLGITRKTEHGILQRVHPCMVPKQTSIARVSGVFNAVDLDTDAAGEVFIEGRGAGGDPTASAVIADICDVARGLTSYPFGVAASSLTPPNMLPMASLESAYYIRLGVIDKPGVLADITAIFRDHGISMQSFLQHGKQAGGKVYMVGTTHTTTEDSMQQALLKIAAQPSIVEQPFSLRIEE